MCIGQTIAFPLTSSWVREDISYFILVKCPLFENGFFIQLVAKYIVVNIFDAAFCVIFKNAASAAAIFDSNKLLPLFGPDFPRDFE